MAYDLSPSKETYRSLRSDVNPITSVMELVDNVLDNWRRTNSEDDPNLTIDIDFDFENQTFRIEDDSGGIADDEIHKIFALGESSGSGLPFSIGSYGMGAKKAIVRLGNKAEIKSRTPGAATGYGFIIDEDWLNSGGWQVDRLEFDELQEGSTVIHVEDLQIEIGEDDDEGEGEAVYDNPSDFISILRDELSETYQEFLLGRAGVESGDLEIKVNGSSVSPPPQPEWALTPFDEFHPRYFKQFKIEPARLQYRDSPVWVNLKVGLLPEGKSAMAGTDIIIQDRKIISNAKDETGGWGEFISEYGPQKRRTKIILELRAEENPEDLPWDTQKSHIDTTDEVAQEAFNFLGRASDEYAKARYERFPTSFTSPYTLDSEYRKGDAPEELDYSSQYNVTDSPDGSYTEAVEIQEIVELHQKNDVFIPWLVQDQYQPGYRATYDPAPSEPNGDYSPDTELVLQEPDNDISETTVHAWLRYLQEIAAEHAGDSKKIDFDGNDPWWKPFYERCLDQEAGEAERYSPTEPVPATGEMLEELDSRDSLPVPILDKTAPEETEDTESPDEEEDEETSKVSGEADDDQETSEGSEDGDNERDDEIQSGGDSSARGDDEEGSENDDEDEEESESRDGLGGTEGKGRIGKSDGLKAVTIPLSEEKYNALCEEIEEDPNEVSPTQVGREVVERGINITPFIDELE